jgi:hypothetical protein
MNLQKSTLKHQRNTRLHTVIIGASTLDGQDSNLFPRFKSLRFGISLELGVWDLELF